MSRPFLPALARNLARTASVWGLYLLAGACGRLGFDERATSSNPDAGSGGSSGDGSSSGGSSGEAGAGGASDASVETGASSGGVSSGGAASGGTSSGGTSSGGSLSAGGAPPDSGDDAGCGAISCDPWWNAGFSRRRRISFDQSAQPGTVDDLPVLVQLDGARVDYASARSGGQDVRFVDADGALVLPHEIERWDASGTSVVWVRVPRLDGGTDADHFWMYYGNAAAADGQQRTAVWTGYEAVYHLDDTTDASGNQPAAIDHGTAPVDGIGGARDLDGVASYVDLGSNLALLQGAAAVTVSARVRVRSVVDERALVSLSINSPTPTGLSRAFVSFVDLDELRAGARAHDADPTSTYLTTTGSPVGVGSPVWQHVAAVMDLATHELLLFVDGAAQLTDAISVPFAAAVTDTTPTSFNALGAADDGASQFLDAALDEVRVAPLRRSAAWIDTDARSQADTLLLFGSEERLP